MGLKATISFKSRALTFKEEIQSWSHLDYVEKSLSESIESSNFDYIMRKIRDDVLRDSTVTVVLIRTHSAEDLGPWERRYVKRELQASLYNGTGNTKSGIRSRVAYRGTSVFGGSRMCLICSGVHNLVRIDNSTAIREFSYNYYLPNDKCAWGNEDRYCVLIRWDDFKFAPNEWINLAFSMRTTPIASKIKVRFN